MSTAPRLAALITAIALAGATAGGATPAFGASFKVNATHDAVDAARGDGVCADTSGACTLRAAIMETNALPGSHDISLPAGTYALTIPGLDDVAASGDLDIAATSGDNSLRLSGAGSAVTIIDAGQLDRALGIYTGVIWGNRVEISGVTIRNGLAPIGAGIDNFGDVILTDVRVMDNTATGSAGILNFGLLTIRESTITGNSAEANGGGIGSVDSSSLTLEESTVGGNSAGESGGGIYNRGASLIVKTSTISSNTGGGIANIVDPPYTSATATIANSTITGNTGANGGILNNTGGSVTMTSTIVSNSLSGVNCNGPLNSGGHNLSSDTSCNLSGPGDLAGVQPQLTGLQDNGGPTPTHGLYPNSPAIDAGDNNGCPPADQRGIARPQGAACDIGAYEYVTPPTRPPTEPPTEAPPPPPPPPTAAPTTNPTLRVGSPTPSPTPTGGPTATATRRARRLPTFTPTLIDVEPVEEDVSGGSVSVLASGLALAGGLGLIGSVAGGAYYWRRMRRGRRRPG